MRWLYPLLFACSAPARPRPPEPPPSIVTSADPAPRAPARKDFAVELSPMSIVSSGTTVTWTDAAGAIWTMPAEGGTPRQLSDQHRPGFAFSLVRAGDAILATGRTGLYAVGADGSVRALPITNLPARDAQPEDAVADAGHVYITLFKRDEVLKIPAAGGRAERLARIPRGVLALAGETLYVASYATGVLHAVPVGGGPARELARGLPRPTALAADATHAYVYCERDGAIRRIELATGASETIARGLVNADELVADGDHLYTRTWGKAAALVRVPKAGGPIETLVDGLRSPYRIALDAEHVWVTSRDDSRIVRLPR